MRFADLLTQHLPPNRSTRAIAVVAMLGESAATLLSPWLAGQLAAGLTGGAAAIRLSPAALVGLWRVAIGARPVEGGIEAHAWLTHAGLVRNDRSDIWTTSARLAPDQ